MNNWLFSCTLVSFIMLMADCFSLHYFPLWSICKTACRRLLSIFFGYEAVTLAKKKFSDYWVENVKNFSQLFFLVLLIFFRMNTRGKGSIFKYLVLGITRLDAFGFLFIDNHQKETMGKTDNDQWQKRRNEGNRSVANICDNIRRSTFSSLFF